MFTVTPQYTPGPFVTAHGWHDPPPVLPVLDPLLVVSPLEPDEAELDALGPPTVPPAPLVVALDDCAAPEVVALDDGEPPELVLPPCPTVMDTVPVELEVLAWPPAPAADVEALSSSGSKPRTGDAHAAPRNSETATERRNAAHHVGRTGSIETRTITTRLLRSNMKTTEP